MSLPAFGNSVPVLTSPAQLSAAFDPDGVEVWCDFAEEFAYTNDGHCQYCGRKDHQRAGEEG